MMCVQQWLCTQEFISSTPVPVTTSHYVAKGLQYLHNDRNVPLTELKRKSWDLFHNSVSCLLLREYYHTIKG